MNCIAHVNESWRMYHIADSCLHVPYERVMTHLWMSHVPTWMNGIAHVNESWHIYHIAGICVHVTYEWVMSRMNESCHVWMSHDPPANESCSHVHECYCTYIAHEVVLHLWMRHDSSIILQVSAFMSRMDESWPTCEWVMSQRWLTDLAYCRDVPSCHVWMIRNTPVNELPYVT